MVERLDGLARITLEELAITHSVKDGILQNACSTKTRMVVGFGEKCSFAHRQVDAQPTKWSKSKNDKSAVAILKGKLARKRICHRWMSRSTGATLGREVIRNWDRILLNVNFLMHGNRVSYFRT